MKENSDARHDFKVLKVEGDLPSELQGTLYRAGPGGLERFGKPVHPFLADGAITAVRMNGTAKGAFRFVESEEYREEERRGRSLYDPNAPLLYRIRNGLTHRIKNTGNTNLLVWQGRLFALMEAGKPVEMDARTLDTIGTTDLGMIRGAFSAHPHRVDALKATFNFGVRGNFVDLFVFPDEGRARQLTSFKAPWISLIHDFIVTDKHAIFFLDPSRLVRWRALLGLKDFSKYFVWDSRKSSTIVTIPLDNPDQPRFFEVDPFRVWHFANAFEDGEEIVVDACRHENIGTLADPINSGNYTNPELWRFRLTPKKNRMSDEPIWRVPCEFPMVHPRLVGARHRYVWVQTYRDRGNHEGFALIDTKTGTERRWHSSANHAGSEPLFVPGRGREEEGWILQLMQDPDVQKSYLAVVDSLKPEEGPVAKLWFDRLIPMTFHGQFIPDASQRESAS